MTCTCVSCRLNINSNALQEASLNLITEFHHLVNRCLWDRGLRATLTQNGALYYFLRDYLRLLYLEQNNNAIIFLLDEDYSIARNEFNRNGTRDSEFADDNNNRDVHGAPGSRVSPSSSKSSNQTHFSTSTPSPPNHSPQLQNLSLSNRSSPQHSPSSQGGPPQMLRSSVFPSAARRQPRNKKHCSFCKNNGERELVFMSHNLKTEDGIIICPVLRNYVCPICNATGDWAHTLKYCPRRDQ